MRGFHFLWVFSANAQLKGFASYNTDSDGAGKCSLPAKSYAQWTSVGPKAFGGSQVCGACIFITNIKTGKNTTAHVVDQCLGCGSADLNLSVPAFSALGDIALGLLPVSWSIVRCNDTVGNIQYYWQPGSNRWWGAVQIRNHADAVATLEYSKKEVGPWTKLTRRDDNYFIATGLDTPVFFRVNSTLGKSILDSNMVPLENGGIVISSGQF